VLKESVELKLCTVDQRWTSKCIRAVVTPGLCTSIILGQSFLVSHSIVIDYAARTVTDKRCNRDILASTPLVRSPPTHLEARRNLPKSGTVRHQKAAVLKEFKIAALPFLRKIADRSTSATRTEPKHFLGLVRIHIEQLASAEHLKNLDSKFKECFADCFTDLPHTNDLPTDVYHRVKLKDANQTIACRGYACPRKYKDAWATLIQQHLDAGRIHPSNSPYLSPAFIVPKSDATVLPRWVNDYRKINANTVADTYPLPRIDDILANCV